MYFMKGQEARITSFHSCHPHWLSLHARTHSVLQKWSEAGEHNDFPHAP
jgi:hypothetical protein